MSTEPPDPTASRPSTPPPKSDADEVTALLPPSSASRQRSPARQPARKASVSARSISGRSFVGSLRHYGATTQPSPVDQAPRVSPHGQRRVLTTAPLQTIFFVTVFLTFASLVLSLVLLINTVTDLGIAAIPYRGFAEFWIAAVGAWSGLGGVFFFSHPSYLFFITTLLTLLCFVPLTLLSVLSPWVRRGHFPLVAVPLALGGATVLASLLCNYLVRRAKTNESNRIRLMLADPAREQREESIARALVGLQGNTVRARFTAFVYGVFGLIAGLAAFVVVLLLTIDMSISAYDGGVSLPSPGSRLVRIAPDFSPWPITIHLACVDPPSSTRAADADPKLPTIVYNAPSGVPGSLALLDGPLPPAKLGASNPGQWLYDFQRANRHDVGRVCTWDRPGYGFSDVLANADLGRVADVLYHTLNNSHELDNKLLLVGEGYGGLVSRVFAARHADLVASFLHLDAQTAQTYFNESDPGLLFVHRITARMLPALVTPLAVLRLPSTLLRRSSSLSRILASVHPSPSTARLSDNMQKARLQESFGSHTRASASFRALLETWSRFPRDRRTIVLSSQRRMDGDDNWAAGQDVLAHDVTGDGLVEWTPVKGAGHYVCEGDGKEVCERSLLRLLHP